MSRRLVALSLGLALSTALCQPQAARADSAVANASIMAYGAFGPVQLPRVALGGYGSSGGPGMGTTVGDVGGTNNLATFTFLPGVSVFQAGSYVQVSPYYNATLTLATGQVVGIPTFNVLLYTGSAAALSNPATAYNAILASSQVLASGLSTSGGPAQVSSFQLNAAVANAGLANYYNGGGNYVTVAITSGNLGGAGVPGPLAGAGLPFLAGAGLAWYRRRRKAAFAA